ncbi:hypothetical protein, partial [Klebsiella pneumoniae]|uniref:hypothetical protein n=1 Tax=Klebsiella pneumoniae TaxID=573 RepID=UPI001CF07121
EGRKAKGEVGIKVEKGCCVNVGRRVPRKREEKGEGREGKREERGREEKEKRMEEREKEEEERGERGGERRKEWE